MTVTTQTTVRSELAALVGDQQVRSDEATCLGFMVDGMLPRTAIFPSTPEQVAAVLLYANEHRLALIPFGSGTKINTGAPPRQYDIALSLQSLKRIIHYEPADLTIGVEAGITLHEFQERVGANNLWLPLDPRGATNSTLGGIIAANASGPLRQGYGGPRDMVIGLKVATTGGKIIKSGGRVVKNVAGYDLGKLFTGSMGTLGVIVEANLKLFPKHPARATFAFKMPSLDVARELRRGLLRSPLDPMRLVLLDGTAANLVTGKGTASPKTGLELWIELGASHRVIERCMLDLRHLAAAEGATCVRLEEADRAWDKISNVARWLQLDYRDMTVLKSAHALSVSEQFVRRVQHEATAAKIPVASFSQVGVGITHCCILQDELGDGTADFIARLREVAAELGGTLIVEHSCAELKRAADVWGARSDDLVAMRKLKALWDPNQVLAPGRFVDGI